MNSSRKICVVTGSRADYGLIYWLLKEIQEEETLQLQIIVTGMHLSPEFGLTYRQIESDGFVINAKVETLLSSDTPIGVAKSMGLGVLGFSEVLDSLNPDVVVLLGDRFEILAAAQVALILRIPIAHIHGGETSEGAYDEGIRHAITKLAQWHFVAAEPYRKRIIQMGESPDRVFNYGAPGLDQLQKLKLLDLYEIEASLHIRLESPLFLVTYHPETLSGVNGLIPMQELLNALDFFPTATIIFTYPNADNGSRVIIDSIDKFIQRHPKNCHAFNSLGQLCYLSLMKQADIVIGNSSSGLIEAPYLNKAVINIGNRQKGRLKASCVIDSVEEKDSIIRAIKLALSSEFREQLKNSVSEYGFGDVSKKITTTLRSVHLSVAKSFHDYS